MTGIQLGLKEVRSWRLSVKGGNILEVIGGNIEIILEIYCVGTELRKYIGGYSAGWMEGMHVEGSSPKTE